MQTSDSRGKSLYLVSHFKFHQPLFKRAKFSDSVNQVTETLSAMNQTMERILELKHRSADFVHSIQLQKDRLLNLTELISAFNLELLNSRQKTGEIRSLLDSFSLFTLKALLSGIEKDGSLAEQIINSQEQTQEKIGSLVQNSSKIHDSINTSLDELRDLKALLSATMDATKRARRELNEVVFFCNSNGNKGRAE